MANGEAAVGKVVSLLAASPLTTSATVVFEEARRLELVSLDDSEWLIVDTAVAVLLERCS